jgi:hypothetical protein
MVFGSIIMTGIVVVSESHGGFDISTLLQSLLGGVFVFFLFAMIFIGIQSIVYSLLMEFVVNPYIKNRFMAVLASVSLGTLSGTVLNIDSFALIGAAVGLIVGIILRSMYPPKPDPDTEKQARHTF